MVTIKTLLGSWIWFIEWHHFWNLDLTMKLNWFNAVLGILSSKLWSCYKHILLTYLLRILLLYSWYCTDLIHLTFLSLLNYHWWPPTRPVNAGVSFDTRIQNDARVHGPCSRPWTRVECTELYAVPLCLEHGCHFDTSVHGPWIRVFKMTPCSRAVFTASHGPYLRPVNTGNVYRP